MQAKNNFKIFVKLFENNLSRLESLPIDKKTDEVSIPLYLHKNFLVRKIFHDRFKTAYKMTSYKDKTVLDYGCGSGLFLESIAHEIRNGIGVDLDIEVSKKILISKNTSLTQIKKESDILQFSNIDMITSFDVLEHVIDLDYLIECFSQILCPGGLLIISGPTENFLYGIARKVARLGIKGNLKGNEEHVRNIFNIRDKILEGNFEIQKDESLWNLFHVMSFKKKNPNNNN